MKLFTRYLNSAAYFDGNNDQGGGQPPKTPVQLQRESIQVINSEDNNPWKGQDENNDNKENEEGDNKEANDEEEDDGEGDDDKNENENETDEQKKERIAQEKQARKEARMQKRIDKLTAENSLTKTERDQLKKQLEAKPDANLTEEEVQRRATELAQKIVNERLEKEGEIKFNADAETLQKTAIKADPEFMKNINEAAEDVGPIPRNMIGILANELDHENGGEVLAYLAKNIEEYEELYDLSIPRMTRKLIRLSDKLKAEADAAKEARKKERSKVPPPITPVNEGRNVQSTNVLPNNPNKDADSMEKFVRMRNEQDALKRKQRGF